MAHQLRPLARLFRAMAELIDQDHASQSRDEAIAKAAGVVAARATAQELVAGRRWPADGAELLATPYAFHAVLPRQAATAAHVQVMQPPGPVPSAGQRQAAASPASSGSPRLDAGRLPGSRLGDLDPGAMAKLWTLLSDLRGGQAIPRGELIRLTGWLPADLVARLLALLEGGPELVGAQAAWVRNAIDPNDPATPVLAVVGLGWLEAAGQVLAAGSSAHELQVVLSVADRHGQLPRRHARQQPDRWDRPGGQPRDAGRSGLGIRLGQDCRY